MSNKISVKEYLENNELLEVIDYISYVDKVNIVDSIMKQVCVSINSTYNLDSVLLDRVKTQIFIEKCTNLDLSIIDENLDGYDLLKKTGNFDKIINLINNELLEFERILQLRINDFIRDKASVKGILSYKIEKVIDCINVKTPTILERIENIDVKSMINNFSLTLDKLIKQKK